MSQQDNLTYVPADEDFKLWRFLGHTSYVISRLRERELAQCGLTPEQAYVLDIIDASGGTTNMGHIVEMTLRPHHTISTLIARMEKHGMVQKKLSRNDKRSYEIIMTESGRELFQKVTRKSIEMAFSVLSKGDKRELSALLARLLSQAYELSGKRWDAATEEIPCSW